MAIFQIAFLIFSLTISCSVSATADSTAPKLTPRSNIAAEVGQIETHQATLSLELRRKMENESFWGSIAKKAEEITSHSRTETNLTLENERISKVKRSKKFISQTKLDSYLSASKPQQWKAQPLESVAYRLGGRELLPSAFGKYTELASYVDAKGEATLKVVRLDGWGDLFELLYDNEPSFLQDQAHSAIHALIGEYVEGTMSVMKVSVAGCKGAKYTYIASKERLPFPRAVWHFTYKNQVYIVVCEDKNSSPEFAGVILRGLPKIIWGSFFSIPLFYLTQQARFSPTFHQRL